MGLTADDYRALCQNLLPSGPAWSREPDAFTTRLLDAWAQELARIDARVDALIEEADPRTTTELLPDWERNYGLPDECLTRTTTLLPGYFALTNNALRSFSRASTATYFDSAGVMQTAPANIPRFDYDPVSHARLGLLIEAAATNQCPNSDVFSAWTLTRSTLAQPGLQTLRGTLAYKLVEDTSAVTTHYMQRVSLGAFNSGDVVCVSALVHGGERTQIRLGTSASGGFPSTSVIADLSALTTTNFSGTPVASGIIQLGGGWFRVWCAVQATSSGTATAQCILANGGTSSYTGDGASGLYVDAVQIELGSSPSSYIPTTGTAAARAADVAVVEVDPTVAERRGRLLQKVAFQGGQSRQYFIDFLAALGYPGATITEYKPFKANSKCNAALNQAGWRYAWLITVPSSSTAARFNAKSRCNEPLARFGDPGLACILAKYKPAHTILYIGYGGA
jgi:uncharacterized protein YmfQ (DUF2313 family)